MSSPRAAAVAALLAGVAVLLVFTSAAALWVAAHQREFRALLGRLGGRPWPVRLRARHARAMDFLIARLRPQGAYGLSLTVGLASLGLAVAVFGGVTEDVLGREELALLDLPVTTFIAGTRTGWLTAAMQVITTLGSVPVIAGLVAAAGTLLRLRTGSSRPLLLLATVSAAAAAQDALAKTVVARPRPPALLSVTSAPGYAYPSGHTVQAAVYGCLAYLIARSSRAWLAKVAAWAGAFLIAVLVGLSRVYLGVHWLTDVLGAWALAAAWLAFALTAAVTIGRLRPSATLLPPPCPPPEATGRQPGQGS